LADPTRRRVFRRTQIRPKAGGPYRGGDAGEPAGGVKHLKVFKEAGLVNVRRDGTRRIYEIDQKGLAALRRWLDQFWDHALDAFRVEAETAKEK
jgi:hypothetical protein